MSSLEALCPCPRHGSSPPFGTPSRGQATMRSACSVTWFCRTGRTYSLWSSASRLGQLSASPHLAGRGPGWAGRRTPSAYRALWRSASSSQRSQASRPSCSTLSGPTAATQRSSAAGRSPGVLTAPWPTGARSGWPPASMPWQRGGSPFWAPCPVCQRCRRKMGTLAGRLLPRRPEAARACGPVLGRPGAPGAALGCGEYFKFSTP
mmetsp:Transcript_119367/g.363167  ORF Transcript_119367/g.363167 Transcript_119367/m.363167 type:complete len:206 (+) Transcript_119367:609-1226(+)